VKPASFFCNFVSSSKSLVGLLRLGLNHVQFLHNLRNGPVGFGIRGVDVAAGGDVVVVFCKLGVIDDAAEFFLFFPPDEGVGDALDPLVRDSKDFPLPLLFAIGAQSFVSMEGKGDVL